MLTGQRITILALSALLAGALAAGGLLTSTSAQNPPAQAVLPMTGSMTTEEGRQFNVSGSLDVDVADLTAGEIVLIGAFTGALSEGQSPAVELTAHAVVLPLLGEGPGEACERLKVDAANLLTDTLHIRPSSTDITLELAPDTVSPELRDGLCRLPRVSSDSSASIDEAVFNVNGLLR
jgi:hypothetical protein